MDKGKKQIKRPVGRPRLGKTRIIIVIDPGILALIDRAAKIAGLGRSAYIEACFRGVKFPKF